MAPKPRPPIDRLAAQVALTDDGCLQWVGHIERHGYARLWVDGKNVSAHRWSYEYFVGPIPEGLVIDHLCRNRACVNPDHLEPVTTQENVLRGIGPELTAARGRAVTHCVNGHQYDDENTYRDSSGTRSCWTCKREHRKKHYELNRQRYIERAAEWRSANLGRSRQLTREATSRYRAKKKAEAN